jgi:hypothetical protein
MKELRAWRFAQKNKLFSGISLGDHIYKYRSIRNPLRIVQYDATGDVEYIRLTGDTDRDGTIVYHNEYETLCCGNTSSIWDKFAIHCASYAIDTAGANDGSLGRLLALKSEFVETGDIPNGMEKERQLVRGMWERENARNRGVLFSGSLPDESQEHAILSVMAAAVIGDPALSLRGAYHHMEIVNARCGEEDIFSMYGLMLSDMMRKEIGYEVNNG